VIRTSGAIKETRVFLARAKCHARNCAGGGKVSALTALVPPDAGRYKASGVADPSAVAALIVHKLIAPPPALARNWRYAPAGASPDNTAGTEADLETRIDEPLALRLSP